MFDYLKDLYRREPARCNAVIATVVVTVASRIGFVFDQTTVLGYIGVLAGFLGLGEVTRTKVRPVR